MLPTWSSVTSIRVANSVRWSQEHVVAPALCPLTLQPLVDHAPTACEEFRNTQDLLLTATLVWRKRRAGVRHNNGGTSQIGRGTQESFPQQLYPQQRKWLVFTPTPINPHAQKGAHRKKLVWGEPSRSDGRPSFPRFFAQSSRTSHSL